MEMQAHQQRGRRIAFYALLFALSLLVAVMVS